MSIIAGLDAIVVGQGEETLQELLDHLPDTDALGEILGLIWRDADGQIVRNAPRPLMADITGLPMPAWDLFEFKAYQMHMISDDEEHMLGVMTMRGCPHRCVFCGSSILQKVQFMAPETAVDHIEHLHKTYGMTAFRLYDDTPLAKRSHAVAFCEELLRRDLNLQWWSNSRAQQLDSEMLALMRRTGCNVLSLGVETGSPTVLKGAQKDVTCEEMLEAFGVIAGAGFEKVTACLLLGLPGETGETIDESVVFVKKLRDIVGEPWREQSLIGQMPLMYPGTKIEAISKAEGMLPEDFSWNSPYLYANWHLPLANRRYWAVPLFENRDFPLPAVCRYVKKHHWGELSAGRKRRYRRAPWMRIKRALGLKKLPLI